MAKKQETKFKEKVIELLKRMHTTWIVKIQQKAKRGTPDILLCVNGFTIALELKDGGELDKLQKYNIVRIKEANGYAFECDPSNFPEIYQFLKDLSNYQWTNKPVPPEV